MNIEKITLNNLTAIEGEQVIDFTAEPLRSAALFAITGDTGSGKSTILDAICLALYNKAPRFEEPNEAERLTPRPMLPTHRRCRQAMFVTCCAVDVRVEAVQWSFPTNAESATKPLGASK